MSSNTTGDVPDTGTGPAAPAEVADAGQVAQLTDPASGEPADALDSEPSEDPAPEPEPDPASALPEDIDDPDDPGDTDYPGEADYPGDTGDPALAADAGDFAEPAGEYEPVEFAEPVEEYGRGRRGHPVLLTFGFVLAALVIVGGAIAIVGSVTHGFKKPVKVTYTKSAIFSLKTGECIDSHGQSASILSCATPHDAEVFATFTLPDSKWPGDTAVQAAASAGCATKLTAYINPQLAISLSSTYVYPNMVAWQAGTRTVICEVTATSGQLTGSVRGATATAG
jgi:hypothetical protein